VRIDCSCLSQFLFTFGVLLEVIGPLGVLIAAFDIIVCIAIQFEVKRYSCTEIDLKITRETVLLTRKVLNWDQFMDLMLRIRPPIHPRERFNEVEVDMSNFEYPLTPSLEAEVSHLFLHLYRSLGIGHWSCA